MSKDNEPDLAKRAQRLGLWGLLAHIEELGREPAIEKIVEYEEAERARRSLERRVRNAKLGRFKSMADFDWKWPREIDRELIEEVFELAFLPEAGNVVVIGPNGVGKTMVAKNLAHQAILRGYTAGFVNASELLNDLGAQETASALLRRLRHYSRPQLLVIDEVGYLSSSNEHADLLFEVVNRRYQEKSVVLTTNKAFSEWNEVFANSGCVVTLIDRLVHKAEVVKIDGESYRLKEAKERSEEGERRRARRKKKGTS